ncbi:sensor histidine kinase [Natrinema halophilum]|uniref:histidine kinase n=1 Tax=Natrinema halophilum TaxID=1699371 RepID=A0A7D5H999_9EURY|nr:HAMP domain-containing sensor histidine kinase [Natrinema halophilum]QLG50135.1 HAMP domain-containing histidine kinase [Natrinema halophilum]
MSHDTSDRITVRPSSRWLQQEHRLRLVSWFSALSFFVLVGWWIAFLDVVDVTLFLVSFISAGVPALGLIWGCHRVERSDIETRRYPRIAQWCIGGGIGFLALNLLTMVFFPWYTLVGNIYWAHFSVNVGAVGGFAIGYVEARAIRREVKATAATVRTEQLEDERELLTYLNDLLRHEVLNSSQIIGGHASLVRTDCDDEQQRDRLETIERESENLVEVIRDVRAMLDANRGSETGTRVDLAAVLEAQLVDFRARFDDAVFETDIPSEVHASGNQGVRWIFSNLLENAIVHNDSETPRVHVAADATAETVTVTVADNGSGIPEGERRTLFERRTDNHGLGLYLSDILAHRYDGTIELDETGPDGSVFVVTLPRSKDDTAGALG